MSDRNALAALMWGVLILRLTGSAAPLALGAIGTGADMVAGNEILGGEPTPAEIEVRCFGDTMGSGKFHTVEDLTLPCRPPLQLATIPLVRTGAKPV